MVIEYGDMASCIKRHTEKEEALLHQELARESRIKKKKGREKIKKKKVKEYGDMASCLKRHTERITALNLKDIARKNKIKDKKEREKLKKMKEKEKIKKLVEKERVQKLNEKKKIKKLVSLSEVHQQRKPKPKKHRDIKFKNGSVLHVSGFEGDSREELINKIASITRRKMTKEGKKYGYQGGF